MNKDKLRQVATELKGASKKHSGQADKIMSAIQYSEVRRGLKDKSESSFKLKDACYYKAKRAHKVFPSAYASGMIAKCRKVGAANFGKSKKKKK
jgi:hypothetical protein